MLPRIPYVAKDGRLIPLLFPCKYDKEEIFKMYFKSLLCLWVWVGWVMVDQRSFTLRMSLDLWVCVLNKRIKAGGGGC